ncbi:hypothetical protein SAMD00019534_115470 [Acytostelium subglobosum LB1]|uniref:hypothetical protein n=1 Tax=Acytostelium subglobosum LB1 TaxID=1410327 RepID=UPI00064488A4|nr:hypothetical protein SAMD00019534_115470 [Acytostelium subglobosum LB1]GAM28371.1 hypothetical protein SAMD00019534_115470 [Acytostelium subglobosum LB1]|eukprot:XP_012748688.1 hypothetical protein SAMD00019534_115470 [Acytostelium subglobosum LB1]
MRCNDPSTLLRLNTPATDIIRQFILSQRSAIEYIKALIQPFVVQLEVSSEKLLKPNAIARNIISRVLTSGRQCPPSIRYICFLLRTIIGRKFHDHWTGAVCTFIFFRTVLPALISPHVYGIELCDALKFELHVRIAKCLQVQLNDIINDTSSPMHDQLAIYIYTISSTHISSEDLQSEAKFKLSKRSKSMSLIHIQEHLDDMSSNDSIDEEIAETEQYSAKRVMLTLHRRKSSRITRLFNKLSS